MTIDEIARELGVSKSTVSRALSGKGRIGQETREKIRAYAEAAGVWSPEEKKIQRKRVLGVLVPSDAYTMSFPFFQECLLGISETAAAMQYDVMICNDIRGNASGVKAMVEAEKVDAMILMRNVEGDSTLRYLSERDFPTGLVGRSEFENVIQVDTDNKTAAKSMTSMLIQSGYHRFSFVYGDWNYRVNEERCEGFLEAIDAHGFQREKQMVYGNFTNMELLDSVINDIFIRRAECIICGDDAICTHLMSRLQAEGYRIPQDISIASLYNSNSLDCFSPAVTAVNVSARQMGNVIGKQVINYLEGNEYQQRTMLDYEILFRKSAGKVYQV